MNLEAWSNRSWAGVVASVLIMMTFAGPVVASDHLDSPSVIADPRADIGDLFAWTSYEGKRLNLVMTIVGHAFSEQLDYVFYVDSGKRFGQTMASTSIACRIVAADQVDCKVGDSDIASGDASGAKGLEGKNKRFRVFAGLRDDPFFNNVKGTRKAYGVAAAAVADGAPSDASGCTSVRGMARDLMHEWSHTDGGPGKNFLSGWTPASLVVSVDLDAVSQGGTMLAVWATTARGRNQIDRMGRPLTGNALLGSFSDEANSDQLKERYNSATPSTATPFIPAIEETLGIYDGFDGQCGNQLLAQPSAKPGRYRALAELLADDRLWIDSESTICGQFFSVELAALTSDGSMKMFCGGRTPNDDAVDIYRSLLVMGSTVGIDDGVAADEHQHSISEFPFLAAP